MCNFRRSVLLVTVLSLALGCGRNTEQRTPDQSSAATPPLKLGAVLPLTGDVASYGRAAQNGIDLAVSEINARGGVNGKPIQVVYEDDQGQASRAISAMEKLVSIDKVPLIMGSAASSVTLAMCPVANRNKVVLITPISSSQELTGNCGEYFFRVCPSDVVQARMMADWMHGEGRRRVGLLYVKNSWGQGLRDEFTKHFTSLGGTIVREESCNEGDRDLRAQLNKLAAAKPEAIYGITYGREGGAMLRQLREMGRTVPVYGADVWGSPELVESARDAAKGVRIIVPAKLESELYREFERKFTERHKSPPDVYASYAYDMMNLIASALQNGNSPETLRTAIATAKHVGVTGETRFDENGDVLGKGFERRELK